MFIKLSATHAFNCIALRVKFGWTSCEDIPPALQSHYFLVLIDTHSKWIEAFPATSPSSNVTIELLRPVCAQFEIPETIISDNGSCFISEDFQQFLKSNGIKQITSAPYHPSTNSLAEKAVQIVKKALKKPQLAQLNLDWQEFCLHIEIPLTVQLAIHWPNC